MTYQTDGVMASSHRTHSGWLSRLTVLFAALLHQIALVFKLFLTWLLTDLVGLDKDIDSLLSGVLTV